MRRAARRDQRGQHPRLPEPRRSLLTAFPNTGSLLPALGQARRAGHHRDPPERDHGDFDARAADEGSARAARRHPVGHPQPASLGAAHGRRRGPCGTTTFDVVGARGDRSTPRPRAGRQHCHRRGDARAGELGRPCPVRRTRHERLGRSRSRTASAMGGPAHRSFGRLAPRSSCAR